MSMIPIVLIMYALVSVSLYTVGKFFIDKYSPMLRFLSNNISDGIDKPFDMKKSSTALISAGDISNTLLKSSICGISMLHMSHSGLKYIAYDLLDNMDPFSAHKYEKKRRLSLELCSLRIIREQMPAMAIINEYFKITFSILTSLKIISQYVVYSPIIG